MTTHVFNGTESDNKKGSGMTDASTDTQGTVKKAVTTVTGAVTSAAGTVAGKAKDVATSDTVTKAKDTVVTTVKDPEARKKAVDAAKENRSRIFAAAGAVLALVVFRKVRKA